MMNGEFLNALVRRNKTKADAQHQKNANLKTNLKQLLL